MRGCEANHPKDIVTDIRLLMHRDWSVRIIHVHKQYNLLADNLAKLSHRLDVSFSIFYSQSYDLPLVEFDEGSYPLVWGLWYLINF